MTDIPLPQPGDHSIFENQADVVENIEDAAEKAGVATGSITQIKEGKPTERLIAKKNCKWCWGRGTVLFVPSPQKRRGKKSELSSGTSFSIGRNTSAPETAEWRAQNAKVVYCRCVRVQLE